MRLFLIRHGQTPSNVAGALDTARPGAPLTELGEAQARALPEALAALPGSDQIAGLYASELIRTQLTIAPLAAALAVEPVVMPGLEEVSAGALEMRTDHEAYHEFLTTVGAWLTGDLAYPMPGGPNGHDFFARFDHAVAQIAAQHPDGVAAAVSHGSAIYLWSTVRAANVDVTTTGHPHLNNTGVCVMEGSPEAGWEMLAWHHEPSSASATLPAAG